MLLLISRLRDFTITLLLFFCVFQLSAQNNETVDSLSVVLSSAKADSTRVRLLFEIGRENWFARNFKDAARYLNQSVTLAVEENYFEHQADAYNLLANIFMKQESFDTAFAYLQKAWDQHDKRYLPLIHETYSKLYYQLGDYQSSLKYALMAVDGYKESPDPSINMQLVYAYLMVGDVFDRLKQSDRAMDYYQKAYLKGKTSGKNWYIKTPMQRIAGYYLLNRQFDRARHLYDTIIAIDQDAPSQEPTMHSHEGLGNIAMLEGNFKQAIASYRTALRYALKKNLSINIVDFYTQLGSAFLAGGQMDSAQYYLELAIRESPKSKHYSSLSAAYKSLSELRRQQKKYPEALGAFQQHNSYHDSILNVEKIRAVNNLEILYRTRQKESEIELLQQESDFATKKRNIYMALGGVLLLAMGVILFLVRRDFRHKQRMHEEKVTQMEKQQQVISLQSMINGQEAERTRMARDLHDGLGGLFSTVKMYFSTLEHEHEQLKNHELFRKSYALVDNASVEIRRIAHNMMPEVLMKMGLINAVKDLCDNISAGRLLKVSLEVHGMNKRLNTATEVMLYRIIQELLNNIVKHAQATEAIIQFIKDDDRLSVVVEDNGRGFNTQEADERVNSGIDTIKSRVSYLNGKMTIDSQKGVGTTVMMDFLINEP